ncbi:MAG: hypothetical protein N2376_04370, partial [Clostridia bacterium]|nr:hypothetical protein [Clostridia bacterium]
SVEPYAKLLHETLIKALRKINQNQTALQPYHDISERFYHELGVKLGPSIRSLHKDILQSLNHVGTNITAVKSELMEKACEGAFFCDYEIFKHLYRLEVRSAERGANSVLICLVTMSSYHNAMPSKEILNEAMAILKDCILSSLRKGDVVARFSPAQYILMINHTKVSVEKIVKRAVERFKNAYNSTFLKVSITTEPKVAILPVHVDKGQ